MNHPLHGATASVDQPQQSGFDLLDREAAHALAVAERAARPHARRALELEAHDGTLVSSADFRGRPYLLFFYPKASTPG